MSLLEALRTGSGRLEAARLEAARLEPRRLALAVGAGIVFLAALGAVDLFWERLPALSLDGERTVPAVFSAMLLLAAGLLAWQVAGPEPSSSYSVWRMMGAFFIFMGMDELLAIHERVSSPVTGISWQVVYAPIVLGAAVGWVVILRRLPSAGARLLWAGGAAAWFCAQVIEAIQWDGNRLVHAWTFIPEETLEMAGSAMWALALLGALRRRADSGDGVRDVEPEPGAATERVGESPRRLRRRTRGHASKPGADRVAAPGGKPK